MSTTDHLWTVSDILSSAFRWSLKEVLPHKTNPAAGRGLLLEQNAGFPPEMEAGSAFALFSQPPWQPAFLRNSARVWVPRACFELSGAFVCCTHRGKQRCHCVLKPTTRFANRTAFYSITIRRISLPDRSLAGYPTTSNVFLTNSSTWSGLEK